MNKDLLASGYEKLEGLLKKLPGGIQKPILRELEPMKEIFLRDRPARIVLLGGGGDAVEIFTRLCAENEHLPRVGFHFGELDNGWRMLRAGSLGSLQYLDLRHEVASNSAAAALHRFVPDLVIFISTSDAATADFSLFEAGLPPVIALADPSLVETTRAALNGNPLLSSGVTRTLAADDAGYAAASEAICDLLPNEARLQFARLSGSVAGRERVAATVLKSFAGITGVIGMQPIPLADLPVLTALQSTMVLMIASASGRSLDARTMAEFVSAVGVNLGAALLFREAARGIVRIVPIWGNAVSGFVAGAGTYAIGKAAIAYFVTGLPQEQIRKILRHAKKEGPPALPPPTGKS